MTDSKPYPIEPNPVEHRFDKRLGYLIFTLLLLLPSILMFVVPEFVIGPSLLMLVYYLFFILFQQGSKRGLRWTLSIFAIMGAIGYHFYLMTILDFDVALAVIFGLLSIFWILIIAVPLARHPYLLNIRVSRKGQTVRFESTSISPVSIKTKELIVEPGTKLIYKGNSQANSLLSANLFTDYIKDERANKKIAVGTSSNPGFLNLSRYVHLLQGYDIVLETIPDSAIDKFVPKLEEEIQTSPYRAKSHSLPPGRNMVPIDELDNVITHASYVSHPPSFPRIVLVIAGLVIVVIVIGLVALVPFYLNILANWVEFLGQADSRFERRGAIMFLFIPLFLILILYTALKVFVLIGRQEIETTPTTVKVIYSLGIVKNAFTLPVYLGLVLAIIPGSGEVELTLLDGRRPYYHLRIGKLEDDNYIDELVAKYST